MANFTYLLSGIICGSCKQPCPESQTNVDLLLPTNTIFCGTNHTTIYTWASPIENVCNKSKKNLVLRITFVAISCRYSTLKEHYRNPHFFLVLCLPMQVRTSNGAIQHDVQLSP